MKSIMPRRAETGGELSLFGGFPFSRMRDELERLFARMAGEMSAFPAAGGNGWRWGLDVESLDDKVVVRAEAPGFEAGDFELNVEGDVLTLRASKKTEAKDDKGETRRTRECYEALALPPGIDRAKVEAKYVNGVLTVTLPRTPAAKPQKIAVKPG